MPEIAQLLEPVRRFHQRVRDAVVEATERAAPRELAGIAREQEGDTIYAIDRVSEELLIDFFEREIAAREPLVLVAEGLPGGRVILPRTATESEAVWRIIVDPIDGTRGLMYQKRSAWILTGVAPNKGPRTTLQDVQLAVQTEIPLVKQHLSDELWAVAGQGAAGERFNRITGEARPFWPEPSRAADIGHGFATVARFFPGARAELAAIDDEIAIGALGPVNPGKAHCFEDQYISTGGQLYELMAGHDRFVADLRPLMEPMLASRGMALGLCCHPYDLCTELIARELGVIVTDERGLPVAAPFNVEADLSWVGYANPQIRSRIEPLLQKALRARKLL